MYPSLQPELLNPIRLAFWSEPSHAPTTVVDLTEGPAHARSKENSAKYKSILRDMKARRESNESRDAVLMAPSEMQNRIAVVQGLPGAGKTRTLRDMIITLTKPAIVEYWQERRKEVQDGVILTLTNNQAKQQAKASALWTPPKLGDLVLVRDIQKEKHFGRKLESNWMGPRMLTEVTQSGVSGYVKEIYGDKVKKNHLLA